MNHPLRTIAAHLSRGRRGPRGRMPWITAMLLLLLGMGSAAYGFWASTTSSNNAVAAADTVSPGSKPAVAANGTAVTVTWAAGTTAYGRQATGYTVMRYPSATGGTGTPATGACTGTVTSLSCNEDNVPGGIWYYTVTPAIALWTGAESPRSDAVSSDAAAPVATVTSVSPVPNAAGWNNTSPVVVTVQADDGAGGSGVASITYQLDGSAAQTVTAAVATIPVSGDGTHTLTYFATDNAGNAGTAQTQTIRIDQAAPGAPSLSVPAYVNTANVAAVPVSGTAEPGAVVTVAVSDGAGGHSATAAATASGTGQWSASVDVSAFNQGTVTYSATVTDVAGNTGPASTVTSIKDTVAPAAPGVTVPAYVNSGNVAAVPVSGTAEAGGIIAVTITDAGGQAVTAGATASGTGAWSVSPNLTGLAQGTLTYRATVRDVAGNTGAATTVTDTKDTVAPALTLSAPRYVNSITAGNLQVSGTAEAGVLVTLTVSGTGGSPVTGQATATSLGAWSVSGLNLTAFSDGSLTFAAATADAAGNGTSVTAPGPNTKDTALPAVSGVSGTNGANGSKAGLDKGDLLTITFTDAMDPAKFCPTWTGTEVAGTVTLSNGSTTTNDAIGFASSSCSPISVGTILLGADYVGTTPITFSGNGNNASTLTWDSANKALVIKFGSASGNFSNPAAGFPSYTPASGLTDLAGNPLGTTTFTSGTRTSF